MQFTSRVGYDENVLIRILAAMFTKPEWKTKADSYMIVSDKQTFLIGLLQVSGKDYGKASNTRVAYLARHPEDKLIMEYRQMIESPELTALITDHVIEYKNWILPGHDGPSSSPINDDDPKIQKPKSKAKRVVTVGEIEEMGYKEYHAFLTSQDQGMKRVAKLVQKLEFFHSLIIKNYVQRFSSSMLHPTVICKVRAPCSAEMLSYFNPVFGKMNREEQYYMQRIAASYGPTIYVDSDDSSSEHDEDHLTYREREDIIDNTMLAHPELDTSSMEMIVAKCIGSAQKGKKRKRQQGNVNDMKRKLSDLRDRKHAFDEVVRSWERTSFRLSCDFSIEHGLYERVVDIHDEVDACVNVGLNMEFLTKDMGKGEGAKKLEEEFTKTIDRFLRDVPPTGPAVASPWSLSFRYRGVGVVLNLCERTNRLSMGFTEILSAHAVLIFEEKFDRMISKIDGWPSRVSLQNYLSVENVISWFDNARIVKNSYQEKLNSLWKIHKFPMPLLHHDLY